MEEQNTTNPNEKNELPKAAKPKQVSKKNDKPSFSETAKDYKAEFKKIIWPNREVVAKNTVTVIVTSLLIGAIIFCMDTIYTTGLGFIINLLG